MQKKADAPAEKALFVEYFKINQYESLLNLAGKILIMKKKRLDLSRF